MVSLANQCHYPISVARPQTYIWRDLPQMTMTGFETNILWCLPFVGLLLSIATVPAINGKFWHHNFQWFSLFWGAAFLLPALVAFGLDKMTSKLVHVMIAEYIPFIVIAVGLYTISGGIRLKGRFSGTPLGNTMVLMVGAVIASWMGTTGASMLLIRPMIRANRHRKYYIHTFVFFIFIVANIGGSLTPIGDPPLFLGLLYGVPFFWPTQWMFEPMLMVVASLLAIYLALDSYLYRKEGKPTIPTTVENFGVEGWPNFFLLAGVVGAVLISGLWKSSAGLTIAGEVYTYPSMLRDGIIITCALVSWFATPRVIHERNEFNWFPIKEVAILFLAVFICMLPVMYTLKAGPDGALAFINGMLTGADGQPNNMAYFWITGGLSAFLDNAPTYLVFFQAAGGDAAQLTGPLAHTLLAISMGAVFMGAMSYIGNAPNFMVLGVVRHNGLKMPHFFGYIGWSCLFLLPILVLVSLIFL